LDFSRSKTAQNAEGGVHSISFVYLVKPKGESLKLDGLGKKWGWFKDVPERLKKYSSVQIQP
jgi:hypothetical protein